MCIVNKAVKKARLLVNDALFAGGLVNNASIFSKPGQRILVYHGIDKTGNKTLNGRFISAAELELQIRFLSQHAAVVSLDDYFARKFDPGKFTVAITFDDGYQNNLRYALPILEKYKTPATFFLTAAAGRGAAWLWMDFLDVATRLGPSKIKIDGKVFQKKRWRHTLYFADADGRKLVDWARYTPFGFLQKMETAFIEAGAWANASGFSDYWALLSSPEIRQIAASPYAAIGAHGYTHQDLAVLTHEMACSELLDCKTALEKICGKTLHTLAYPFGTYTRALLDYAENIGFSQQLAVDFLYPEDHIDRRLRERLTINPYISPYNQWLAIKKGGY